MTISMALQSVFCRMTTSRSRQRAIIETALR